MPILRVVPSLLGATRSSAASSCTTASTSSDGGCGEAAITIASAHAPLMTRRHKGGREGRRTRRTRIELPLRKSGESIDAVPTPSPRATPVTTREASPRRGDDDGSPKYDGPPRFEAGLFRSVVGDDAVGDGHDGSHGGRRTRSRLMSDYRKDKIT